MLVPPNTDQKGGAGQISRAFCGGTGGWLCVLNVKTRGGGSTVLGRLRARAGTSRSGYRVALRSGAKKPMRYSSNPAARTAMAGLGGTPSISQGVSLNSRMMRSEVRSRVIALTAILYAWAPTPTVTPTSAAVHANRSPVALGLGLKRIGAKGWSFKRTWVARKRSAVRSRLAPPLLHQ